MFFATAFEREARAFSGFYVAGADAHPVNNATQVVLMRDGTRTVLSMQNDYQGPPESFAMIVPVPVVLQKENVRTLPRDIFARVDQLTAPRLVEYWEADPCAPSTTDSDNEDSKAPTSPVTMATAGAPVDHHVRVEAQFAVGEYDIVILSAADSLGLDAWLKQHGYRMPDGAEPYLRPYVQAGSKFFVAKVDIDKVRYEGGVATLSPLRFYYDSDSFTLPVRLGLLSSAGVQDLIIEILARSRRYEVANYTNVIVPTNIEVADKVRGSFGAFYAALFDKTLATSPRTVVTEYAWSAASCDPCPTPSLEDAELALLGADVITKPDAGVEASPQKASPLAVSVANVPSDFVVTRLHARYAKDGLGEDLVFRAAPPIEGGREYGAGHEAAILATGQDSTFQARYVIRHAWEGAIACEAPQLGVWGGPPMQFAGPRVESARDLAFAPRGGVVLASLVTDDVPQIGLKGAAPKNRREWHPSKMARLRDARVALAAGLAFGVLAVILLVLRERRRPFG